MIVYSFFLNYNRGDDYNFMIDHVHCLKPTYTGFHPVIKNPDGSFQVLYAMTRSKKLKNMFILTRDMSKFKYYKSEVSSKKFKEMKDNLNDTFLLEMELIDGKNELSLLPMSITTFERDRIKDEIFFVEKLQEIFRSKEELSLVEHDILNEKFNEMMKIFKLQESIDLLSFGGANDSDIEFYENDYYISIQKFSKGIIIKTLEIFIELFGNTLKY